MKRYYFTMGSDDMVTIVSGATNKPVSSEQLKSFFLQQKDWEGYLYIGYPIIGTPTGPYPIDAIWISPKQGLVAFDLIEGKVPNNYQDRQDECFNKLESKLKGYQSLTKRRKLMVEISTISYAPAITNISPDEDYFITNNTGLTSILNKIEWTDSEYYEKLVSVLQAISTIRQGRKKRIVASLESKGAKLQLLEDSIANLDSQQSRAVIETVEGVQRIRGLAGSGKTIVLALKAAYLHAKHPEWKIAVTFNTRSLKGQFKRLIEMFYLEQTNEPFDENNLQIIHAWGAPGDKEKNGIYYSFCIGQGIEYFDYRSAINKFGRNNPFGDICKKALSEATKQLYLYDAILIDEAQDFSPEFLQLCYNMLNQPKRLVYAYDELQNLGTQSLPSPEKIFGTDENGNPNVTFKIEDDGHSRQDIILEKCYRNSRPTLVAAHALGFGIYRKPISQNEIGLVQMFDQSSLWNDIGYEISDGELKDGQKVVLQRTPKSSPEFLENHSPVDDLITFKKFDTIQEQNQWVADSIERNLKCDELRHDDIIVINPNPLTTKAKVGPIRSILYEKGIQTHTAGVDTSPDIFFKEGNDSVAFTGIYRAKGNEAAMVYIVNAEDCYYSLQELAKVRNQLFTAMTRSKAWVRVLGVGSQMDLLIKEYNEVKKHRFTLDFCYPTEVQRQHLKIINRDMSESQKKTLEDAHIGINSVLSAIEGGNLYLDDLKLNQEQIDRLLDLFSQGDRH